MHFSKDLKVLFSAAIDFGYLLYSSKNLNLYIDLFHLVIKLYCLWNIYKVNDLAKENDSKDRPQSQDVIPLNPVSSTNNVERQQQNGVQSSMLTSTSGTKRNGENLIGSENAENPNGNENRRNLPNNNEEVQKSQNISRKTCGFFSFKQNK